MKSLLHLGLLGALLGALLGLAVWSCISLFAPGHQNGHAGPVVVRTSPIIGADPQDRGDKFVPYNFEAVITARLVELALGFDRADSAKSLLTEVRPAALKYEVISALLDTAFRNPVVAEDIAVLVINQVPTEDTEFARSLLARIASLDYRLGQHERGSSTLDSAITIHEAVQEHFDGKYPSISVEVLNEPFEFLNEEDFTLPTDKNAKESPPLGLLPIFMAVVGFLLAALLTPFLSACGQIVVGPALAELIRRDDVRDTLIETAGQPKNELNPA